MVRSSRNRRRAALTKARRQRSSFGWYIAAFAIVVAGVTLIALSRDEGLASPKNPDHWHAALGINVCGEWLPDAPEFHDSAENANLTAGLHTHGDGLVHIHPYVAAESGDRADLDKYFEYGGWSVDSDSFEMWDGQEHTSGDMCGDSEATVRWTVNGEERTGDPSSYNPHDGDIIAIALLPEGEEIGTPPSAPELAAPQDLQPQGDTVPSGTVPSATAPGDTSTETSSPETAAPDTSTP